MNSPYIVRGCCWNRGLGKWSGVLFLAEKHLDSLRDLRNVVALPNRTFEGSWRSISEQGIQSPSHSDATRFLFLAQFCDLCRSKLAVELGNDR